MQTSIQTSQAANRSPATEPSRRAPYRIDAASDLVIGLVSTPANAQPWAMPRAGTVEDPEFCN